MSNFCCRRGNTVRASNYPRHNRNSCSDMRSAWNNHQPPHQPTIGAYLYMLISNTCTNLKYTRTRLSASQIRRFIIFYYYLTLRDCCCSRCRRLLRPPQPRSRATVPTWSILRFALHASTLRRLSLSLSFACVAFHYMFRYVVWECALPTPRGIRRPVLITHCSRFASAPTFYAENLHERIMS